LTLSFRDVVKPEGSVTPRDMCMPRLGVERAYGCGHPRGFHVIDAKGNLSCRHPVHGPWFEDCGPESEAFPAVTDLRERILIHNAQKSMGRTLKDLLEANLQ